MKIRKAAHRRKVIEGAEFLAGNEPLVPGRQYTLDGLVVDSTGRHPHRIVDRRSLIRVIAIADACNHAILTEDEFTGSAGRLVRAGLMGADVESDAYWMTEAGLAVTREWRGGLFGWIKAGLPALRLIGEPSDGHFALPEGVFRRAVDEYLKK